MATWQCIHKRQQAKASAWILIAWASRGRPVLRSVPDAALRALAVAAVVLAAGAIATRL